MSLITSAGLWNNEESDITENKKQTRRVSSFQPSLKQEQNEMVGPQTYQDTNSNMNNILNKINNINIKNSGDNLMKFNPIPPPQIQNKISPSSTPITQSNKQYYPSNLDNLENSNYKKSYTNTITPLVNANKGGDNSLMERINYMIHTWLKTLIANCLLK